MDELATGGPVEPGPEVIIEDNSYVIPKDFARKWAQELLDRLNGGVIE